MNIIKEEAGEAKGILRRIKRRDFKGNSGQVIKNSSYQITTTIIAKGGSLLFTMILARILLPELFGFYSLALSTLIILSMFSDLGLSNSIVNFISKSLAKKDYKRAKSYFSYVMRIKLILLLVTFVVILSIAYFISFNFYDKPIFLALLVGSFYIVFSSLTDYLRSVLTASNNFKPILIKETFFQILRVILVPAISIILIKYAVGPNKILMAIFIALSLLHLIGLIYIAKSVGSTKQYSKEKTIKLSIKEKTNFKKFALPLSAMVLSGFFFNYVDILMLGHFVLGEFIAFYSVAISLAGSFWSILAFASIASYPVFSKLKGKRLNRGFRRTRNITVLLSALAAIFLFLFAGIIVQIIYGSDYLPAINILKMFSILILIEPLTSLYTVYYMSVEKTRRLAIILIFTSILNIVLNYFFITSGLSIGMMQAVLGAAIATIISRSAHVLLLGVFRKR